MKGNEPRYSRVNRKKMRSRSNQLLNVMIGLVILLIIIVGASIILGNNDDGGKDRAAGQEEIEDAGSAENETQPEENSADTNDESEEPSESGGGNSEEGQSAVSGEGTDESSGAGESATNEEESGTVTIVPDNDEIIKETVINPGWQPIGTVQTGVHESKYDREHVDWEEKQKAISYATGHAVDELIYWKIKNGGSPQKSIGIVSTRDKTDKYRIFLEWVDEKGWKPVQMDILNTLDFEY